MALAPPAGMATEDLKDALGERYVDIFATTAKGTSMFIIDVLLHYGLCAPMGTVPLDDACLRCSRCRPGCPVHCGRGAHG